jgi:Formate/nitrite transporter
MWLPIMTFFAHGYEHSVVNMFVIPAGRLFGAPVSLSQWWIWNQIPVTLGNFFSGALLTGLALYVTNSSKKTAIVEIPVGTDEPAGRGQLGLLRNAREGGTDGEADCRVHHCAAHVGISKL